MSITGRRPSQERQRDVVELIPPTCMVKLRCFVDFSRNAVNAGRIEDDVVSQVGPEGEDDDGEHDVLGITGPGNAVSSEGFNDLIDESDLRVENTSPPDNCRCDHRGHARQEHDHPEEAPGLVALHLADQCCDGERNNYIKCNCNDGEYDGILKRFYGVRVIQQFSVIIKSNKPR